MVSLKDGILRLNFSSGIPDLLWGVSFFMLMLSVICFGSTTVGANYFYYFVFFLFIGISLSISLAERLRTGKIYISLHTLWYGLFVLLAFASSIWADSFATSFVPLSKIIQILAVTYCLILYLDRESRLQQYIRTVLAASAFLVVYLFVKTPAEQWFSGFLGAVTSYNSNDVGCALTIAVLFSFFEAYVQHRKAFYFACIPFFFTVILTSSRKALFMSVLGVLLMVTFNYRARNYILRVLCAILAGILAIVLIYNIPFLYQTVGVRLDNMIEYLFSDRSNGATIDYSLTLRRFYIDMAKSFFKERPFFGIGLNNFSYRILEYGKTFSYAHNNYWEIAADLGIVGFITYYWFYAYLFVKLARQMIDGHKSALLFMTVLLLFIIFEYGMVNYYKMQVHLVLAAAFCAVSLNDGKAPTEEKEE
ncbi:MAG: O-antigen ligase family protein [Acutalibacteraceae bacterium]